MNIQQSNDNSAAEQAKTAIQPGHSLPAYYYLSSERYKKDENYIKEKKLDSCGACISNTERR